MVENLKKQSDSLAIKIEKRILILCFAVMATFAITVMLMTDGTFAPIATPYGILALIVAGVWYLGEPKLLLYMGLLFGISGAVSALWLFLSYLPWYMS